MYNTLFNFFDELGIKQESSFKSFNSSNGLVFKSQFINTLKKLNCKLKTGDMEIIFKFMDKERKTFVSESEYYYALKVINQNPKLKLLSNAQMLAKQQKMVSFFFINLF